MGERLAAWDGQRLDLLAAAWGVPTVEAWSVLTSTSDRAAEAAAAGCAPWTVIVADEQSAGRGRRGDAWQSAAGAGLWMTVVAERPPLDYPLPLLVGASCVAAIDMIAPSVRPLVKWPNDLYARDRKLGGVLCESRAESVLIGIGINTSRPDEGYDPGIEGSPVSLEEMTGKALAPSQLAGAVIADLRARLAGAGEPAGTKTLLAERDYLADRTVRTEEHGVGVARGFDDSGALVLERADGSRVRVGSGRVRVQDAANRRG